MNQDLLDGGVFAGMLRQEEERGKMPEAVGCQVEPGGPVDRL